MKLFQWLKSLFKNEINPYSVADRVTFRNVDKTLTLYVRSNAATLVVNLRNAQENLKSLTDEADESKRMEAAKQFAQSVFGEEQAKKLCEFYGESLAVVAVVGMYFERRLRKKITKAQKK